MALGLNARLERRWDIATTHTLVWPTAELDPERLGRACAEVAASVDPGSFIGSRLAEQASGAGMPVAEFLARHRHRFVATAGCSTVAALLEDLTGRERAAVPFSFVVCRNGFALSHSHALGDGAVSARLLESVLRTYADAGPRVRVPTVSARGGDLARGLCFLWFRRPRAVAETIAGLLRRARRRTAPMVLSPDALRRVSRAEAVGLTEADVAAIERWRRDRAPLASMSVVLLWIVARAVAAQGYPGGPQPWQVMVSMRGAAEGLAGFGGNMVGRALIDVDPRAGADVVGADLRRQTASGEIVALHLLKLGAALAATGLTRLRGRRTGAAAARVGSSPGLSWSDRGRRAFGSGFADVVPRDGAEAPVAYTYVTPGQDGIGVNVNWLGGRAGLLLMFGASPLDESAINGVVAALSGGAHALLPDDLSIT